MIDALETAPRPFATALHPSKDEKSLKASQRENSVAAEPLDLSGDEAESEKILPAEVIGRAEQALNKLAADVLGLNTRLSIDQDDDTGSIIYKTVHKETGEVLRQWPQEDFLRMLGFFQELRGLAVDKET